MPNWCENDLIVKGNKKELSKFESWCKKEFLIDHEDGDETVDFNKVIPYPFEYHLHDIRKDLKIINTGLSDAFNSGGYDWCVQNWGTKWTGRYNRMDRTKTTVKLWFDTAWAPPCPVIVKLSEGFPNLTFSMRFYEQGVGYKGLIKAKGGAVLDEREEKYHGHRGG